MHKVAQEMKNIVLAANPPWPKVMLKTILEILEEWGSSWIWLSVRLIGDDHWLKDAIEAGTCVGVKDGSCIHEVFPSVCTAAFILECSKGRGRIIGSLR